MNEIVNIKLMGLETKDLQPHKTPIITIKNKEPLKSENNKPLIVLNIPKKEVVESSKEIIINNPIPIEPPKIIPIIDKSSYVPLSCCESVMNSIKTGFGLENTIVRDCVCKRRYKVPLYKENYLGEFEEESEKTLARYNLGVYSKKEIDDIVSNIIFDNDFLSKEDVQSMIDSADFVKSTLKSYVDYIIPNDLFTL